MEKPDSIEQPKVPENYYETLEVRLGRNGPLATAYLIDKKAEGPAFVETWWVEGQTFQCYNDQRWRFTEEGYEFGSIIKNNETICIYDVNCPSTPKRPKSPSPFDF